ncbi:phosphopantetheine-binding protein [Streptomyces tanashiensis]|uniref:Phosphopantetheine-binding protein n=1 Tax=Streptomyces tanashiensis TaxID=67367 RepID=A0ABY6QRK6_9ACTN|nr:phosphopantetheine-binding protein [Streptomyces tanashiensis]UZX19816.1 phosphopantetheine-binding protein [Streptomyces tanashiensis]
MNHDQAKAYVRQAVQRVVPGADFTGLDPGVSLRDTCERASPDVLEFVEALAERSGSERTEDDHPALDPRGGCAARLVAAASASAQGRSG